MSRDLSFQFSNCSKGIIFGGARGIGLGFIKYLTKEFPHLELHVTTRKKTTELNQIQQLLGSNVTVHRLDPSNEDEIEKLSKSFENKSVDFIINCIGLLHDEEIEPEKSLRSIDFEKMQKSFSINASITPMVAKHFDSKLSKTLSLFTTISAKVGSIEDNRMGGWYSYRASKAALNMFLKCISIEFDRKKKNCIVLSLHPGTTITELSKPFIQKTHYQLHQPEATAENLIKVIQGKSMADNGKFFAWSGEELPW